MRHTSKHYTKLLRLAETNRIAYLYRASEREKKSFMRYAHAIYDPNKLECLFLAGFLCLV
jgi:hypothetical protein